MSVTSYWIIAVIQSGKGTVDSSVPSKQILRVFLLLYKACVLLGWNYLWCHHLSTASCCVLQIRLYSESSVMPHCYISFCRILKFLQYWNSYSFYLKKCRRCWFKMPKVQYNNLVQDHQLWSQQNKHFSQILSL